MAWFSASPYAESCGGNRRPTSAAACVSKADPKSGQTGEDRGKSCPNQANVPRRRTVTQHGGAPRGVAGPVGCSGDKIVAESNEERSEPAHLGSLSLDLRTVAHLIRLSGTRVQPVSRRLLTLAPSAAPNRRIPLRRPSAKLLTASGLPDGYIADPSPTDRPCAASPGCLEACTRPIFSNLRPSDRGGGSWSEGRRLRTSRPKGPGVTLPVKATVDTARPST